MAHVTASASVDGDVGAEYTRCLKPPGVAKYQYGQFVLRQAVLNRAGRPQAGLKAYRSHERATRALLDLVDSEVPGVFESRESAEKFAAVFRRDLEYSFKVRAAARSGENPPAAGPAIVKRRRVGRSHYEQMLDKHKSALEKFDAQIEYLVEMSHNERIWEAIKGAKCGDDVSPHDRSWVQFKITVVLASWRLLRRAEAGRLDARLENPGCDPAKDPAIWSSGDIANELAYMFAINERTVREYWSNFRAGWDDRAEGIFRPDQRGIHERKTLLDHDDIRLQLRLWLKAHIKTVSVDACHTYINRQLLPTVDMEVRREFGVPKDICRDTAWRWMTEVGASIQAEGKVYYNDQHENPVVTKYRNGEFYDTCKEIGKRLPLYVVISKEKEMEYRRNAAALRQTKLDAKDRDWEHIVEVTFSPGREWNDEGTTKYVHHVDNLPGDDWLHFCTHDPTRSYEKPAREDWSCKHRHTYETCRCHCRADGRGQDETAYGGGDRASRHWAMDGVGPAHKKGRGGCVMLSGYVSLMEGIGPLTMTEAELDQVNQFRAQQDPPRPPLTCSPWMQWLRVGKDHDGFWDGDDNLAQAIDCLDCFEVLHPDMQLCAMYDHSSGHMKKSADALVIGSMNLSYGGAGGKQLRTSTLDDTCVGEGEGPFLWYQQDTGKWTDSAVDGALKVDCGVYAGGTQSMSFASEAAPGASHPPPPPFYRLDTPGTDIMKNAAQLAEFNSNRAKLKKPLDPVDSAVELEGYLGKAKGVRQVLWERRLWVPGMLLKVNPGHKKFTVGGPMCASTVLGSCGDFQAERSMLQKLFEDRGHIMQASPKGHPELAGYGLEFDWGMSKMDYRRRRSRAERPSFDAIKEDARLSIERIDKINVRRFARLARRYLEAYQHPDALSHSLIEKFVKLHKCHRNILDQEAGILKKNLIKIDELEKKITREAALARETRHATPMSLDEPVVESVTL
eukprot:m.261212 g.261212  ORF g.261212 m.261212 type:complete len:959 (-) comp15996_c0_seq9:29-2905(-)